MAHIDYAVQADSELEANGKTMVNVHGTITFTYKEQEYSFEADFYVEKGKEEEQTQAYADQYEQDYIAQLEAEEENTTE